MKQLYEVEVRTVVTGTMMIYATDKQNAMEIAGELAEAGGGEYHSGGEPYDSYGESVSLVSVSEPTEMDRAEALDNQNAYIRLTDLKEYA